MGWGHIMDMAPVCAPTSSGLDGNKGGGSHGSPEFTRRGGCADGLA